MTKVMKCLYALSVLILLFLNLVDVAYGQIVTIKELERWRHDTTAVSGGSYQTQPAIISGKLLAKNESGPFFFDSLSVISNLERRYTKQYRELLNALAKQIAADSTYRIKILIQPDEKHALLLRDFFKLYSGNNGNVEIYEAKSRASINESDALIVKSAFDTLFVLDKFIYRKIDRTFTPKELASLPASILFSADSLEPKLPQIGAQHLMSGIEAATSNAAKKFEIPADSAGVVQAMRKDHPPTYLEFLRNLAKGMNAPKFQMRIVAAADKKRLYLLLKYMSLYGALNNRLEIALRDSTQKAEPDRLVDRKIPEFVFHRELSAPVDTFKFALNLTDSRRSLAAWTFIIEDGDGKELHRYAGKKKIPRRYVWNWRAQNGELLMPGTYYYYLRWKSSDGQTYTSPRRSLIVSRENRRIAIEIMRRKDLIAAPRATATLIVND